MNRLIIMAIVALFVCESCVPAQKFRAPGYVSEYSYLSEISVQVKCDIENDELSLVLQCYSYNGSTDVGDYYFKKKNSTYYKLCQKFGDLYYNQKCAYMENWVSRSNGVHVIADVVTDIRIVSDDDWNSEYTAGTLLNELFSLKYYTVYPYVESRYKTQNITAVDDAVTDMPDLSLKMMMYDHYNERALLPSDWGPFTFMKLYTDRLPENPIQSLHITLTTDEGKTLEYSVEVDLN